MPTFIKYLLFQIPQWMVLALFLWFLIDRTAVSGWAGIGFFMFWVVKDFAIYPFVRRAYANSAKTGTEQLIGGKGVARERLAPEGYIKIQGELWKARTTGEPIPRDSAVRVTAAQGMTLLVDAEDGAGQRASAQSAKN